MSATPIWLTDEDSEIAGYKRAKVPLTLTQPNKSDCPSLVRATTTSVLGPSTVPIARTVGNSVFNSGWLTDPLEGPSLTAGGVWTMYAWAMQDSALANMGLSFSVYQWVNASTINLIATVAAPTLLPLSLQQLVLVTSGASATQLTKGDRILIRPSLQDSGGIMQPLHTATFSYNGLFSRAEGDTFVQCPDTLSAIGDIPDDDVSAIRTILRDASSTIGLTSSPLLEDAEIERYITQAIETYSVNRPYATGYFYSGDTATFDFPLPPRWIWGFSRIIDIEYPASQQIPAYLESGDWEIRDSVKGLQPYRFLRMRTLIPDRVDSNLFVQYSTRHQYNSEFSTIPREDLDAVLWLAGSYSASAISAKYAGSNDGSIDADVVNYRDSQRKWQDVAKDLREMYHKRVIEPDAASPVGSTSQWKPLLETGEQTLWHSRRLRRQP